MAENLTKKPAKGILKASSSFDHCEAHKPITDIKWDEMNILKTLHPPDKDYGHMKIEEPKTPYSYYKDENEVSEKGTDTLDAELLAEKIISSSQESPKNARSSVSEEEDDDEDDEYADETEEERAQRKAFEQKRKMHYNEYYAVKLARQLIEKDDDEDDEEEDENEKKENGEEEDDGENL